ncbi:hypothetical protein [Sphingomonas panacis]|uniref:hypothetical protein n=1 Tax=Sphingomonas panacis TaxID=1560345 RepID=UPI0014719A0E|nr:hypothetical protein [Sphingomonas panacis]
MIYALGLPGRPARVWIEASLANARLQMAPGEVITDQVEMDDATGLPVPQTMPLFDQV